MRRVLSVGQCGFDHGNLSQSLRQLFDAEVVAARNEDDALLRLKSSTFDLVLVNRVFDADGASGLDFIRKVKQQASVPLMLVSNYEDAQREAVAAGALPGFGKSMLGRPELRSCLAVVLAKTTEPSGESK